MYGNFGLIIKTASDEGRRELCIAHCQHHNGTFATLAGPAGGRTPSEEFVPKTSRRSSRPATSFMATAAGSGPGTSRDCSSGCGEAFVNSPTRPETALQALELGLSPMVPERGWQQAPLAELH